jgi:hypothetical protein
MTKLSVVMAVHNGEAYVRESIDSVLSQTISDFEFIIVDDASTDTTRTILCEYERRDSRISILFNDTNLGPYPSANRALTAARGDVIARQDADDVSPSDRFAVQLRALSSADGVALVTGDVAVFPEHRGDGGVVNGPPDWQPRLEWELLFSNAIGAGAHVMFPRLIAGAPILFPCRYRYAEDYGLWCRLTRLGRVVCPRHVVYRYRRHSSSITSRRSAEQRDCLSRLMQEHVSQFLRSAPSIEAVGEISRFWRHQGNRPLAGAGSVMAMLVELRASFLAQIEARFGPSERTELERQIEETLQERMAYWTFRSMTFRDWRSCRELISMAGGIGPVGRVLAKSLWFARNAANRRLTAAPAPKPPHA